MAGTEQELRREDGQEREKLVEAVQALRGEAADVKGKLRSRVPLAAAGALGLRIVVPRALRALLRRRS
jgi:hypothetical protein